jgi:tetratricopeptide (TPR) repeat protein
MLIIAAMNCSAANPVGSTQDKTEETSRALNQKDQETLRIYIEGLLKKIPTTPRLTVGVVQGDSVTFLHGFGHRDLRSNLPVTPQTQFYIASTTKSFTGTAAKMLADEKIIDLDAPIKKYFPDLVLPAPLSSENIREIQSILPRRSMSTHNNAPRFEGFTQKAKYSERFLLDFCAITHSDFNSYGFIARNFAPSLTEAESRKKRAYELIGRYALGFYDSFLKGDASSREFLRKPATNKELLTIAYKPSLPLPPTQEEFFTLLRDKGIQPAYKVFEEVMKRDPDYQIFEAFEITVLADRLYKAGREDDAISAAKLRVKAYPNDYLSYEWVANLYYKKKDRTNALQYYATGYEMALKEPQTAQLTDEIECIVSVSKQLKEISREHTRPNKKIPQK